MRLAIARDALVSRGGAERVMAALVERWPGVPLFTSAYLPDSTFPAFDARDVRTSFMCSDSPQTRRWLVRRFFRLWCPLSVGLDFRIRRDPFVSAACRQDPSSVPSTARHICYCTSPLRLAWRPHDYGDHRPAS